MHHHAEAGESSVSQKIAVDPEILIIYVDQPTMHVHKKAVAPAQLGCLAACEQVFIQLGVSCYAPQLWVRETETVFGFCIVILILGRLKVIRPDSEFPSETSRAPSDRFSSRLTWLD